MATRTVGPSGRDFTSVNAAIQASNDNPTSRANRDLILVDYAVYTETLNFQSPSGGWQIPCIVRAADPNNRPVIQSNGGAQACLGGAAYRGTAVGETELDGLIFSGWTTASNGVCYFSIEGIVVIRCRFTGCANRICIRWIGGTASRYGLADSCTFDTSGSTGTGAQGHILTWTAFSDVVNCKAVCPTNVQFQHSASTGPRLVAHNSVLGTWDSGGSSKAMKGTAGTFRGNLIQNLGTGGSHAIDATGGTYIENRAFGTFTTRFAGTDGGDNLNTDPLFANTGTGDLTLQAGSPASRSLSRSASVLLDILGVTRSDPTDAGAYEMSGDTTVDTIDPLTSTTIKLTMTDAVTGGSTWEDPANFTITPSGSAYPVEVTGAAITDAGMSITLTTGEHTNDGDYDVAWAGLEDVTDGSGAYIGIGIAPEVDSVEVIASDTIRVTFSEPMDGADAALVAPANYVLAASGLVAPTVAAVTKGPGTNPTYVDLTIAGGIRNRRYTLTVKA